VKREHERPDAGQALDELFAHAEQIHVRARASLGRPPVLRQREPEPLEQVHVEPELQAPAVVVEAPPPAALVEEEWVPAVSELDGVLARAADSAASVRGADASLVRLFGEGGARTARGLSLEEAQHYSVGPPPVGPRVRALAIGYEPESLSDGAWPIQVALAVPIVAGGASVGFISIFSRAEDAVFDEEQGWELLTIAASVRDGIEAVRVAAANVPEHRSTRPLARTALLALAAVACVAAPALMALGVHSSVRVAAAVVLLVLAPGAAAAPLFGSRSAPLELGLVAGTSLGISALVAELTLWAGAWSPWWATAALAAVSFASIMPQLGERWHEARVAA
jgi:hypothetical protein